MITPGSILVVAATARELASGPWRRLVCGVGPVDAAAATAAEIARERPIAVLHVGIGGARRASGLALGTFVIGSDARYCDLGVPATFAPSRVASSGDLVAASQRVLPAAHVLPIGTSARVGGTHPTGVSVEGMEGFAVLRAAALAGVPAVEIRVISNEIEETDRSLWQFDSSFAAITAATPALVAEFERVLKASHA